MKMRFALLSALLPVFLLAGCVFPFHAVSADPLPQTAQAIPLPADAPPSESVVESARSAPIRLAEPKLALFWYAMADTRVVAFRDVFHPLLQDSGLPFREFDAENDSFRQLDQIRSAVAAGWNVLAVQLVDYSSAQAAEEILQAAEGCAVLFFDRVPPLQALPASAAVFRTDPEDAGKIQGKMAGTWLAQHYATADRNGDGTISYTMFLGEPDNTDSLTGSKACIEMVDACLAEAGYPPLAYFDPDSEHAWQCEPGAMWPSDAAHDLMQANLAIYNDAADNMIELVLADCDDAALGALAALNSIWYNLGDDPDRVIPIFGYGASVAACREVSLGKLTGTVSCNPECYAHALLAAVQALSTGRDFEDALSDFDDVTSSEGSSVFNIAPLPFSPEHLAKMVEKNSKHE